MTRIIAGAGWETGLGSEISGKIIAARGQFTQKKLSRSR